MKIRLVLQDYDTDGRANHMSGADRKHWPASFGFPLPEGLAQDISAFALQSNTGFCPAEFTATSRWADGSARWVHGLALIDLEISQTREFHIVTTDQALGQKGYFVVEELPGTIHLQNESIQLCVQAQGGGINGIPAIPELRMLLRDGTECTTRWEVLRLDERGKLRASVVLEGGYFSPDGRRLLDAELSWTLTQDQDWIEITHRVRHRTSGVERIEIQQWSASTAIPANDRLHLRQKNHGEAWLPRDVSPDCAVEIEVSPGGARVTDLRMVDEHDINRYPAYLRKGQESVETWIGWEGTPVSLLFWAADAIGKSPQRWYASTDILRVDWIVPESSVTLMQGQGLSQTWRWQFIPSPATAPVFREHFLRHQQPPFVHPDADAARACPGGEWEHALLYEPAKYPRTEFGLDSYFQKLSWPTGLMNWGDGIDPGYSRNYQTLGRTEGAGVWTNNEYDVLFAHFHQMFRTGNGKYGPAIERMAAHAMDVDFLDFHDDEWLHHGSPVHSVDHVTASSYPSHIWTEGLLHYYYVSNDPRALKTAKKSGDFILKYIVERWPVFTLTAREAAWPLLALGELFLATRETKYREGACKIRDALLERALADEPFFPGEAFFFIGVAIFGLEKWHRIEPEARTIPAIERILDWRLQHRFSPEGMPCDHWHSALTRAGHQHFLSDALAIAWRLTGKTAYLERLWLVFQFDMDQALTEPPSPCPKTAATRYRSLYRTLECFRQQDLLAKFDFIPFGSVWEERGRVCCS